MIYGLVGLPSTEHRVISPLLLTLFCLQSMFVCGVLKVFLSVGLLSLLVLAEYSLSFLQVLILYSWLLFFFFPWGGGREGEVGVAGLVPETV